MKQLIKTTSLIAILLCSSSAFAAQKSRATLQSDIGTDFASGTQITAAKLRAQQIDVTDSCYAIATDNLSGAVTTSGSLVTTYNQVVPANRGGAGTISGILKANGTGTVSAAAAGTDYAGTGSIVSNGQTMNTARILGRSTASAGGIEEITLGTGLTLSAGTLTASSGTGDVTAASSFSTDNLMIRSDGTGKGVQNSTIVVDDSGNTSGMGTLASAAHTVTSASASALIVGPNGATNPGLQVDNSVGTANAGLRINMGTNGSGTGPTLIAQSPSSNAPIIVSSKGTGDLTVIGGNIVLKPAGTTRYTAGSSNHNWTVTTSSTLANHYTYGSAADTGLPSGTDTAVMVMDFSATRQHTSNITVANDMGLQIKAPTFSYASATGTTTVACTLCIDKAPVAGTNAIITNPYAIQVALGNVYLDGKIVHGATNTTAGTVGAQTINKATGTVNFDIAASSLVVTNSLVTTSSIVFGVVRTNDSTAVIKNIVPGSGSFTINLSAAATAETSVGFMVVN